MIRLQFRAIYSHLLSISLSRAPSVLGVQDKTVVAVAKKSWIARAGGGRASLEKIVGHPANGEYCCRLTLVP
jgi:hypothetical protein